LQLMPPTQYTPSVFRIYADIQGWITNENMRNKLNS
jgi:hypothetical protein